MQQLDIYQIDAFTSQLFRGNAAAVVPLPAWLPDMTLLAIAQENNLSETAFVLELSAGHYFIRWFSPLTEIDFCGHATLAAAFAILLQQPQLAEIRFSTKQVGELTVRQQGDWLEMNFPARRALPAVAIPPALLAGLGVPPVAVLQSAQAWFAVYAEATTVQQLQPDFAKLQQLGPLDVVVMIARFFDYLANRRLEYSICSECRATAPNGCDRRFFASVREARTAASSY